MTPTTALRGALAVAATTAAFAAADVHARNVQYMVPVAGPLAAARASDGLADIDFAFGSASAKGAEIVGGTVSVQGVASPYAEAHGFKPSDDEVCRLAVRDALKRLAVLARAAGGHAVVGIVSAYNGVIVDDAGQVECRLGQSKVLAPLSGVVAQAVPAAAR
jgi:hypothetical protein